MIHNSRVKFKVSRGNIFQETKKSRIVIVSRASNSTNFYVKNE